MEAVEAERFQATKKVSLITAAINFLLAVMKVVAGLVFHSHALFADGIHSTADLLSDALVLVAAKFGTMVPDRDHPYGHGKIETLGTAILAVLLIIVGIGLLIDAYGVMRSASIEPVGQIVLFVALLSIFANEAMFHYTKRVSAAIRSDLLLAHAWHHRSDALSSFVVLIGVIGSQFAWSGLDAAAAIVVALMIMQMGWRLIWDSLRELIDTGVDEATLANIQSVINGVNGVDALHELRTRTIRQHIFVDVHILVSAQLSVSEGHHIAQQVRLALQGKIPDVVDVTVHIDPEDDELYPPSIHLPTRSQIQKKLMAHLQEAPGFQDMQLRLHYLEGKLRVDFILPLSLLNTWDAPQLDKIYQKALELDPHITAVTILYQ